MSEHKFLDYQVERDGKGVFRLADKDFKDFMSKKGFTPEMRKAEKNAQNELIEEGSKFLKPFVVKEKERQLMKMGTGDGHLELTMHGKRTFPNVSTGEKVDKYGGVSVKIGKSTPAVLRKEGGLLEQIEKEVREAWK